MMSLLPEAAAAHAPYLRSVLFWVMLLISVVWTGLFGVYLYSLLRFREDSPGAPSHPPKRIPVAFEATMFLIEVCLLLFISLPFWRAYAVSLPETPDPLEIRVVAQQFVWNVQYPGPDGVFGRQRLDKVDEATNPLGLDVEDPHAADDIVLRNALHLPQGREVLLRISSKDVVHSFAVPEFYVKRDAIPGFETRLVFTPTVSTAELKTMEGMERDFEVVCSQLCGQGHYQMRAVVTVDKPEEFTSWLAAQSPALGSGEDDIWNQ